MADDVRSARRALGRGAASEALVHLWNAVEPARLTGDGRRLGMIAALAQQVQSRGDEAESREAGRLIEVLRSAVDHEGGVAPATGRLDAEVYAGGQPADDFQPEAEESGRGGRAGNLIWLALVILIVLVNVIGQIRGGG